VLAACFIVTSIGLAILAEGSSEPRSVIEEVPAVPEAPVAPEPEEPSGPAVPLSE